jgi:Domain of unknown function (DUF6265)
MKYLFLVVIIFTTLVSCKKHDENGNEIVFEELYKAHWLLGEWQKTDSLGTLKEIWMPMNDSTYVGQSYFIKDNDTIHHEMIQLTQDGENLIYLATVKGQNNDEAIPFKMTKDNDTLLIFENPKHDYPQEIEYIKKKNQMLLATVSGLVKGKMKSDSYAMKKVN